MEYTRGYRAKVLYRVCDTCQEPQWSARALKNHINETGHYTLCTGCSYSLRMVGDISQHLVDCTTNLPCLECQEQVDSKNLEMHIAAHTDAYFLCPMGCEDKYTNHRAYMRQRKKHPCWWGDRYNVVQLQRQGPQQATQDDAQLSDFGGDFGDAGMSSPPQSSHSEEDAGENVLEKDWYEVFQVMERHGLPQHAMDKVAMRLVTALATARTTVVSAVRQCQNLPQAVTALENSPAFSLPMSVQSAHRRATFKAGKEEIVKGEINQIPMSFEREGRQGPPGYAVQYNRSIKEVLVALSRDETIMESWRYNTKEDKQEQQWQQCGEEVYAHPSKSRRWGEIEDDGKPTLMIGLYSDDLRHAGNSTRSCLDSNVCHGYAFVLNGRGPETRLVNAVWTCHLSYPADYKAHEEAKQWGLCVEELSQLTETGITLANGEEWSVRVFMLLGDQLELHKRCGLRTAFNGKHVDRYSYATKQERINATCANDLIAGVMNLRTSESAGEDMEQAEQTGQEIRGAVRKPLLTQVPHYNPFPCGTAPCPGHDLISGIVKRDLSLSVMAMVELKGWTTVEEINGLIAEFKAENLGKERTGLPGKCVIKATSAHNYHIPGNMQQGAALARYMPLILRKLYQRHQELREHGVWEMILLLAELVRGYASFAVTNSQAKHLESTYLRYLDTRLKVS